MSAPDRSYRKPAPLSEILKTMQKMVDEGHIDPVLFEVFMKKKVYLRYATHYLAPNQKERYLGILHRYPPATSSSR